MTTPSRQQQALIAAAAVGGLAVYTVLRGKRLRRVVRTLAWRPGKSSQLGPPGATLSLDPSALKSKYYFFISAYVPRPIALVSSVSAEGIVNLAPFSYSGIVNHDPGTIVFSCVDKGKAGGDTLRCVKETKQFVCHVISEWYLDAANHTCGNFPFDVDEFEPSGLTKAPCVKVKPPRVQEAALAFECDLLQIIPLANAEGKTTATMVIGTVVHVHVKEAVFDAQTHTVLPDRLLPMSRLGGNTYACLGDIFDLPRPKV